MGMLSLERDFPKLQSWKCDKVDPGLLDDETFL
jgi:hypothetical protein